MTKYVIRKMLLAALFALVSIGSLTAVAKRELEGSDEDNRSAQHARADAATATEEIADVACAICMDDEATSLTNPLLALPCTADFLGNVESADLKNPNRCHTFHLDCLKGWFTACMERSLEALVGSDVEPMMIERGPSCPQCRKGFCAPVLSNEQTWKISFLAQAARFSNDTLVRIALVMDAPINARGWDGYQHPAIFEAAIEGRLATVQLLLEHGADPLLCEEHTRSTALHAVALRGNTEVVKCLLDWGRKHNKLVQVLIARRSMSLRIPGDGTPYGDALAAKKYEALKLLAEARAETFK